MQYSLDTNPPSFPGGVTMENIIQLIQDLKTNFDLSVQLLPQATLTYALSVEDPLIAIQNIQDLININIPIDSMRYLVYAIVFSTPTISTLLQPVLFAAYHAYILVNFNDSIDNLFAPKFDFDGLTESESQVQETSIFTSFPGSFLVSKQILDRFQQPMTINQARFVLHCFTKIDSSFYSIAEVQETAVFVLAKLAISDCGMSDFSRACEAVFDQIDSAMAVTQTANSMYEALDAQLLENYTNFDVFAENLIAPKRTSLGTDKIFRILTNIINICNLSVNNIFRLTCFLYESCKEESVFSFIKKLSFGSPEMTAEFNNPFVEEGILDEEIMDQVDRVVNSFSNELVDKHIQAVNSSKRLNFVQTFFSLRILTINERKVNLNITEYMKNNKSDALSLYFLAYDKQFLNVKFITEANIEQYVIILSRFLLENYNENLNQQLEQIITHIQQTNDPVLIAYGDQIIKNFLKTNEEIELNLQTYRKLFKRNDNLVLALADAFNTKFNDDKLVELALETLPHCEEIEREIVQKLVKSLFHYLLQFINKPVQETPVQAIAVLTAFYYSFDISPAFCGVVNSMKADFVDVFETLNQSNVNGAILPGFLLILTSLFELPINNSIDMLLNHVEKTQPADFCKQCMYFSADFNSYLFVHSAGPRLIISAGPKEQEIASDMQQKMQKILHYYVQSAANLAEISIGIVQIITEAFQDEFSSIDVVFNCIGQFTRTIGKFDYKDCKLYKQMPIGFEIYALAVAGLLTFEHGAQWSSSKYVNKTFITLLLEEALQNTDFSIPSQILRLIFAIKYVRNSFMGEKSATNNFYKSFIQVVKQHIQKPIHTNLEKEYQQLQQSCVSFYIFALSVPSGAKFDVKITNPITISMLELCQKLQWEDQNSLEISFSVLNSLYEQRKLNGKVLGIAEKSLYFMEKFLDEEEEDSEQE
ncbi:hypothetical protein SS50377_21163 [Spironucleus salmonicida]|uniref:Uncharacterized protein n=1 Tax=Spironucleus salmonicida TaxID=348837 RepID=V6LT25_9EUKA|nr:hypothetical protein SS50377_21163 [Spironucleus salmonicida]|eukprot:EST43944.1 Hypothetical protein SS50377_16246 [Spironucleus salmonicida]